MSALEITADLPEDDKILDRWFAEPIRAVILPADIFLSNNKGFPVLSKRHQSFIKRLMKVTSFSSHSRPSSISQPLN